MQTKWCVQYSYKIKYQSQDNLVNCVIKISIHIIIMEDKENVNQQCILLPTCCSSAEEVKHLTPAFRRTRLIKRRRKPVKKSKDLEKVRQKKSTKNKPTNNQRVCEPQIDAGGDKLQKNEGTLVNQFVVQDLKSSGKRLHKISFDSALLSQNLQKLYAKQEKLKNTDLMIPGVKFVHVLTADSIAKWEKALIIYQQKYKKNERVHFGLLIKSGQRLISFDGILKLWPIKGIEKSFHWSAQEDTWSCGYRVLFWVNKILTVGIQRWVNQMENPWCESRVERLDFH